MSRSLAFFLTLSTVRNLLGTSQIHRGKFSKTITDKFCTLTATAMSNSDDINPHSWKAYRLINDDAIAKDWVSNLEMNDAKAAITNPNFLPHGDDGHAPRILVLYGSLRTRSFSRFLAYEFARILEYLGCEVSCICVECILICIMRIN